MIILISINIKIGDNRRTFWEFNSVLRSSLIIALIGLYIIGMSQYFVTMSKSIQKDTKRMNFNKLYSCVAADAFVYVRVLYLESKFRYKQTKRERESALKLNKNFHKMYQFVGIFYLFENKKRKQNCEYPDDIMALNPTFFSVRKRYTVSGTSEITSD